MINDIKRHSIQHSRRTNSYMKIGSKSVEITWEYKPITISSIFQFKQSHSKPIDSSVQVPKQNLPLLSNPSNLKVSGKQFYSGPRLQKSYSKIISDHLATVSTKSQELFKEIDFALSGRIEVHDLVDYLKSKFVNKEYSEDNSYILHTGGFIAVANSLFKTIDLKFDGIIDFEEIFAVYSVFQYYWPEQFLDFSDATKMEKLANKIKALQKVFMAHCEEKRINVEKFINLCKVIGVYQSSDNFFSKFRKEEVSFINFLKWIPFFIDVQKALASYFKKNSNKNMKK